MINILLTLFITGLFFLLSYKVEMWKKHQRLQGRNEKGQFLPHQKKYVRTKRYIPIYEGETLITHILLREV